MNDIWRTFAVHTDKEIHGFFGDYRWLSNMWPADVVYEGDAYDTVEHAYQAAKYLPTRRHIFFGITAGDAKRLGQKAAIDHQHWNSVKVDVMRTCVFYKFNRHMDLRSKLLGTGQAHLEETNYWHDKVWGVDYQTGEGSNWPGIVLMRVRDCLQPVD